MRQRLDVDQPDSLGPHRVGDDGKRQTVIQTVHGWGYRSVAEVR